MAFAVAHELRIRGLRMVRAYTYASVPERVQRAVRVFHATQDRDL